MEKYILSAKTRSVGEALPGYHKGGQRPARRRRLCRVGVVTARGVESALSNSCQKHGDNDVEDDDPKCGVRLWNTSFELVIEAPPLENQCLRDQPSAAKPMLA